MNTTEIKKDYIKALILERQNALHLSRTEMAEIAWTSCNTFTRYMNQRHSDDWPLGMIKRLCVALGISENELRNAVRLG